MWEVFRFEARYLARSPLFLILAVMFFLLAFLIMASEDVSLGGLGSNTNLNAAWAIVYTQFFFSIIGMFAAIAIVANSITRDHEQKTAELFFCTGITPRQFLLGRFSAGMVFGILVGAAAILGTLVASLMPWLDAGRIGPFSILPYLYSLVVVTAPNLFLMSAIFFSVAALTRSMLGAFVGAVGFLVAYVMINSLVDPELIDVYAILDPFGSTAFGEVSRYWTVYERNFNLVPVEGALLTNRLLWLSAGILALSLTSLRYTFSLDDSAFKRKRKAKETEAPPGLKEVNAVSSFGSATVRAQFFSQVKTDVLAIVRSVPFWAILGFATLNVWGGFGSITSFYGTELLPTTSSMLRAIGGAYLFFVLLIIIYYSGEVVYRERSTQVSNVIDATPYPNGVMVAAKVVALWFVVAMLMAFGMLAGIVKQVSEGYTNIELGLYLYGLFFVQGGFFFLLATFAVFIQVMAGNRWSGMAGMLLAFLTFQALPSIGFEHGLYSFGTPNAPHSDMNQYGHFVQPLFTFTAYWAVFCGLLMLLTHLWFVRGQPDGFAERISLAKARLSRGVVSTGGVLSVVFVALGCWIFYNTNVVNTYVVADQVEALQARYEKTYKPLELSTLPEVIAVDVEVDLYPEERRLESVGTAVLWNKSDEVIEDLLISTHPRVQVKTMGIEGSSLASQEPEIGAYNFKFETAMQPGERRNLSWDLTWRHNGFSNPGSSLPGGGDNRVVANGTFVNNLEIMPAPGYNSGMELTNPNQRREHGLEPIQRLPKIGDPKWLNRSQLGLSERSAFRVVFSTSADQVAIAPGYQVGEVIERGGRRIYTYEMDEKIWPFFSFVSARYAVARDKWKDVNIEIYHHPEHDYNVEPMIRGTQKSLDYFTQAFSPYQYRQFRILEFPRYATFAQSFPNTIPFSEAIGFVADLRDENALDSVFYVTAHEMAHQWWGHQVAGARMQGMTVIVETLAQYSALMVMEKEYGKDKMRRFLRYELDRYLQARGGELIEELPLVLSENQAYIHYQKGSLVMYALKDLIGEDKINLALRNFLAKYAYGTGPFPTTLDMLAEFRRVAGNEHQEMITDLFEKITLFDLAVEEASYTEVEDGFEIRITPSARKLYADGQGLEAEANLSAHIDVGIFPEPEQELDDYLLPEPLYFERHRITSDTKEIIIRVSELPHKVGIDPYNKLIDRNPEDNLRTLKRS
ncbi:MAG: M1 family aminopeptidase [Pseudomonadota bacterium]